MLRTRIKMKGWSISVFGANQMKEKQEPVIEEDVSNKYFIYIGLVIANYVT